MKGIEPNEIRVKNKRGRVMKYNPWNHDAEPGDIMVAEGRAWRLYETPGRNAKAGILSMRELKKAGYRATKELENEKELIWLREVPDEGNTLVR